MGTASGLNLTDQEGSKKLATKVATAYNTSASGLNTAIQNIGVGLASVIGPAAGHQIGNMGPVVYAFAQGIGNGTAYGFGLTKQQFRPSDDNGMIGMAGNLGLGISQPIASVITMQKLLQSSGINGTNMMQQFRAIASAAGTGVGEGMSEGLGLAKSMSSNQNQHLIDGNTTGVPAAAEEFSKGLTLSFLKSTNMTTFSKVIVPVGTNGDHLEGFDLAKMLIPIASGAGKGIGDGAAIGLGLQEDLGMPTITANINTNESTEMVVSEFSKGLVAKFLANGTATKLIQNFTASAGGATKKFKMTKVAEGFARGLIEGSVEGIFAAGGIQNVLKGNIPAGAMEKLPPMNGTNFDDSVGGASAAFGHGLAGEGVLLFGSMISGGLKKGVKRGPGFGELVAKQDAAVDSPDLAIDATMLSELSQKGVGALTCQGLGGIASILIGLSYSKTISLLNLKKGKILSLSPSTLAALPKDPIILHSEGSTFDISLHTKAVKINGLHLISFSVITALHSKPPPMPSLLHRSMLTNSVLLTTFAFFFALPTYLILGVMQRLTMLINAPLPAAKTRKWQKIILMYLFTPAALSGIILGIVGMWNSKHFTTPHGIFGVLTLMFTPPTVYLSLKRLSSSMVIEGSCFEILPFLRLLRRPFSLPLPVYVAFTHQLVLGFSGLAWGSGFAQLRTMSLCAIDAVFTTSISVTLVTVAVSVQLCAMAAVAVRIFLERRMAGYDPHDINNDNDNRSEKGEKRLKHDKGDGGEVMIRTPDLEGKEDHRIGYPMLMRVNEGKPDEMFFQTKGVVVRLMSPTDMRPLAGGLGGGMDKGGVEFAVCEGVG
ncbi:hypothetical protein GQ43DRAFT_436338 [Delitschia confertaspora ATCC 74209]|uniref:Cytochrome b561 domain-containing protein n=1 Tax=Delitschia confertaspora ATCC 74209 TaxID=1513339 RepID=A0A9P4JD15_9PLEO|nr:hypothetical protein GQ43DRAFT_436338 [Delitschia confertaspora ATCC 74209]